MSKKIWKFLSNKRVIQSINWFTMLLLFIIVMIDYFRQNVMSASVAAIIGLFLFSFSLELFTKGRG
jgi:hypothetical protein